MNATLAIEDLARLSLQMAVVAGAGVALARALRLRAPRFTPCVDGIGALQSGQCTMDFPAFCIGR
ncbi:MAG TPA: hypothetical protein VKU44_11845 [Terriglobia bacterium]|nr:hypothetical protein [Terriglobia bacterium]